MASIRMRRVGRVFATVACGGSLVLCAAFCVAAATPRGVDPIWQSAGVTYFLMNGRGGLRVARQAVSPASAAGLTPVTSTLDIVNVTNTAGQSFPGFKDVVAGAGSVHLAWDRHRMGWSVPPGTAGSLGPPTGSSLFVFDYAWISIPYWLAIPLTAAPAIVRWLIGRMRRSPAGVCAACGYDLRATPQRCPECGTIPTDARGVA